MNLWLIRHAKSSWANIGQADFDRPLNDRGIRDGKRMIRWMRAQQRQPARIISSDAARARATTEFVQKGFEVPTDQVLFEHRIYEASIGTLLAIVHEIPDSCPSAALVGHNPGMSDFVNALVGGNSDRPIIEDLPTFGVALLTLPPRWVDTHWGCAKLVMLHTPKTLRD
jgi:phosphohistidine phosphatase